MFQAELDTYDEGELAHVMQTLFDDLETEFATFRKTQGELNDIDNGINLKQVFNKCKRRAIKIIDRTKMRIREPTASDKPSSPGIPVDNKIALTKIQLPTFSEFYEDWPGFSDQFHSTHATVTSARRSVSFHHRPPARTNVSSA
jgi:hypothetical protein